MDELPTTGESMVPPTQYLVMETLAARYRLGESLWTFPSTCRPAVKALADRGWLWHKGGVTENTERAWLTDEGRAAWGLDQPYAAPSPVRTRLPEYPFDWDSDGRFAALQAAYDVLHKATGLTSLNALDDAFEAAVKAHNESVTGGSQSPSSSPQGGNR